MGATRYFVRDQCPLARPSRTDRGHEGFEGLIDVDRLCNRMAAIPFVLTLPLFPQTRRTSPPCRPSYGWPAEQ